jgi:hypothetical protein
MFAFKNFEDLAFSRFLIYEQHVEAGHFVGIVEKCTATTAPDPYILRQIARIKAEAKKLEESLKSTSRTPQSRELARKHIRRVKAIRALRRLLKGISAVDLQPVKKQAADFLLAILEKEGPRLIYEPHLKVSSALQVILEQFASEAAQKCIAELLVGELVAEITAAHEDYEWSYQEKVALEAQQNSPSVSPARSELGYRVHAMLVYIDVNESDGQTNNPELIRELNEEIGLIMGKVRARQTRNENNKKQSGDSQASQA